MSLSDPQTESHTPSAVETPCPSFTLKPSDITAPLVIDFWIKCQQRMRGYLAQGFTLEQAEKAVRSYYFIQPNVAKDDVKLLSACKIAGEMEQVKGRRLAD